MSTGTGLMMSSPSPNDDQHSLSNYSAAIRDVCEALYFRQSMIADYLVCPQMMMYKWLLQHEESDTFFSAVMGTAGHSCIEEIHRSRRFDYSLIEMTSMFCEFFQVALKECKVPPKLGVSYASLTAQCNAVAPEYVGMLLGYQKDQLNHDFHCTCIEQSFVLIVKDDAEHGNPHGDGRQYIFTGMIDQAGFYNNGSFALRDIKFRDNAFRPKTGTELTLNLQLTIYAYALRYGVPACSECSPQYSVTGELLYTGPCDTCQAKIGTKNWPKLLSEKTELIWMRDYSPRKKDQYAKFIKDPDKNTDINPKTGRRRIREILNPQWVDGYKTGEPHGPAHLIANKSEAFLKVHMADAIRLARMIKDGVFFRKSGEHCGFWCKHRDACVGLLEMDVQEIDTSRLNQQIGTIDPFGDMG